jgi:hypothetical protein
MSAPRYFPSTLESKQWGMDLSSRLADADNGCRAW